MSSPVRHSLESGNPSLNVITDHLDIWTTAETPKKAGGRGRGAKTKKSPHGIKKLRELILELAVRGKLVPQDPNDEPVSKLLSEIETEKLRLVKANAIRAGKLLPKIKQDEVNHSLPQGWEWVRFGYIAQHNSGKTLDRGRNIGEQRDYITTSNLYWGRFELDNVRQMPIKETELEKCTARKGDLLICEGGEAGRASVWFYDKEICFQNHVHRARFYKGIDPYFAYRFFEKIDATGEINQYRKGVGISNMSGKSLASIVFPLPPLAEQHRIVAKVDELMALCDVLEREQTDSSQAHQTLVETLLATLTQMQYSGQPTTTDGEGAQRTAAQSGAAAWLRIAEHFDTLFTTEQSIDQLKKTILQLAVMGKLVPQNPNDEPASELLKKIAAEKERLIKEKKIKKQKSLSDISDDEKPFEVPKGWKWSRIGDASLFSEYGVSAKTYDDIDGIPVLKMGDIQQSKVVLGGQKKASKSFEGISDLMLKNGDVLYNRTNSAELVGKTGRYDGPDNQYSFASYLIRIRCSEEILSSTYLNLCMNSPLFRKTQIEPHLKQQCGQANVNGTIMKSMLISMPPSEEQNHIVAKVDELMALCDSLKDRLKDSQITQVHLADAIVEQAVA